MRAPGGFETELTEFVVTLVILQAHSTAATVEMLVQAGAVPEPTARHLLETLAELSDKLEVSNPLIAEMWSDTLAGAVALLNSKIN